METQDEVTVLSQDEITVLSIRNSVHGILTAATTFKYLQAFAAYQVSDPPMVRYHGPRKN
jgi:hypothetical protein